MQGRWRGRRQNGATEARAYRDPGAARHPDCCVPAADSTRRIFFAVSASPPCAESEGDDGGALSVCCGLDVHKPVSPRVFATADGPRRRQELKLFATITVELRGLVDWLAAAGCTHVVMESTGVYWRPVYNLLAGEFERLLVNAPHVKAVPGARRMCKRQRVARAAARTRAARGELRAAGGAARTARRGPLPQAVDRGARSRGEPRPEGPRDGEHQARERRHHVSGVSRAR